jgi:hypothetical protein
MEKRTKNSYQTFVYDFIKFDISVTCPNCSKLAIVKTNEFTFLNRNENEIKVICTNCGFNKRLIERPESILTASQNKVITGRYIVIGGQLTLFFIYHFGIELHLKTMRCGLTIENILHF